ncbi:hypothetical protein Trydic_g5453 [Trypoxylus dichotomus]
MRDLDTAPESPAPLYRKYRNPYQPVITTEHWQRTIQTSKTCKKERMMKYRGIIQDITDDEIKDDLQQQDYPVEKISRMKGKNGQQTPLVLIEGEHLSTYIKCPANPNNAAVNKTFIDAPPPKVNAWAKKRETTAMKNETEKQSAKEDPINHSGESEDKLALILGCMVQNLNSTNAATERQTKTHFYNKSKN